MASLRHIWRLESLRQEQIELDYVKKAMRDIPSSKTGSNRCLLHPLSEYEFKCITNSNKKNEQENHRTI